MRIWSLKSLCCFPLLAFAAGTADADEVTDWNQILLEAMITPPTVAAFNTFRPAAIVHAAVFDAVNGIEHRYAPVHVTDSAPPGASRRAAAVQAAYASLIKLFPAQASTFDQARAVSLNAIASGPAAEHSVSIERGIEWGQAVADAIWAWRSSDGSGKVLPPYVGGLAPGQWQPTPPAFAPGSAPQIAQETPWVIASPSQFRPAGPPALTSSEYAAVFNETKSGGSISSASRTSDQTLYAEFWQSASPVILWDPVATSLATDRHLTLEQNARLFALLNISQADAIIGCWDAKYTYSSWRPVTAIEMADSDGNPDTAPDVSWTPLIVTPSHPEYPSAHSCASGAAAQILSHYFGRNTAFSMSSALMPGVMRYFPNFSAAMEEVKNARIFGGIHFRTACNDGQILGEEVGQYVLGHALLAVDGERDGERQQ
jgi:hypothetical protein